MFERFFVVFILKTVIIEDMIKNRVLSFGVILFVYLLAVAGGTACFNYLNQQGGFSFEIMLLIADVFATAIVFAFSLIFRNASVYDPYWSVQPPVILFCVLLRNGGTLFSWILFAAILIWGLRLTGNWAYNFTGFDYQDWRYTMLKEKSGPAYPLINFLGIHLFPTLVVYLCILPAVEAVRFGAELKSVCLPFLVLSFLAPVFQGLADLQMHSFRKEGSGGFIRTGLWKHSRHPNYACEILMWWSVGLACFFALDLQWPLLTGALVNTLMFLFVSIPMADKRQSRKPGFAEYKKSTRML